MDGSHLNVVLEFMAPGDLIGMPGEDNDVQLDVIVDGLGRIVARTHVKNRGIKARQAIYCTPIDGEKMHLRGVVNTVPTEDPDFTAELSHLFYESFVEDFAKDFPIWENKRYVERPKLSAADGPIGLYRKWSRQFYPKRVPHEAKARRPSKLAVLSSWVDRARELVQERLPRPQPNGESRPRAKRKATSPDTVEPTLRVSSAEEYFDTLDTRFAPDGSKGIDAVFQWKLSGSRDIARYAVVKNGTMELHNGEHGSPTVTIAMDADDYVRMVNREIDGALAFTTGRAKLKGSIPMAMKMRAIFPQ
jgi:putative sterol carrier protein